MYVWIIISFYLCRKWPKMCNIFIRQTVEVSYDLQTKQKTCLPAIGSANLRQRKTVKDQTKKKIAIKRENTQRKKAPRWNEMKLMNKRNGNENEKICLLFDENDPNDGDEGTRKRKLSAAASAIPFAPVDGVAFEAFREYLCEFLRCSLSNTSIVLVNLFCIHFHWIIKKISAHNKRMACDKFIKTQWVSTNRRFN